MKRRIFILCEKIRQYFPDLKDFQKYCLIVNNLLGTNVRDLPSQDNLLQEQFIDLVNDGNTRSLFSEKFCCEFWIEMAQTYLDVSKMALKVLIPCPTKIEVWICIFGATCHEAKSLKPVRCNLQFEVKFSQTEPNIAEVVVKNEVHPPHW